MACLADTVISPARKRYKPLACFSIDLARAVGVATAKVNHSKLFSLSCFLDNS